MFTIEVAGHSFQIENKYDFIQRLCQKYIVPNCDAKSISVTDEQIKAEDARVEGYSEDYLESLAVYRKICDFLVSHNIILFHCSALMIDGKAVLFTAPSGTGKSTHASLWRKHFGDRTMVINDDKPLVKIENGIATVYGTPWCGKHGLENNIAAPVDSIFILSQAKENSVEKISPMQAYPMLLNQTYRPKQDTEKMRKILTLVNEFIVITKLYNLKCNISNEAVLTAYNAMKGC